MTHACENITFARFAMPAVTNGDILIRNKNFHSKAKLPPAGRSIVSREPLYKDVCLRTMEMIQYAYVLKAYYRLKVNNALW